MDLRWISLWHIHHQSISHTRLQSEASITQMSGGVRTCHGRTQDCTHWHLHLNLLCVWNVVEIQYYTPERQLATKLPEMKFTILPVHSTDRIIWRQHLSTPARHVLMQDSSDLWAYHDKYNQFYNWLCSSKHARKSDTIHNSAEDTSPPCTDARLVRLMNTPW